MKVRRVVDLGARVVVALACYPFLFLALPLAAWSMSDDLLNWS